MNRRLVIWRSSADPIPDQLGLRIGEIRPALRHPIAGDAGAGDLAVEIRVRGISWGDSFERRQLVARHADGTGIGATGTQDHVLLVAERIVASDRGAGRCEDLVLHAGEGGGRVDWLATAD